MGGKRKKHEQQPSVEEVRAPHRRRARLLLVQVAAVVLAIAVPCLVELGSSNVDPKAKPLLLGLSLGAALVGVFVAFRGALRARLRECRDLVEAEHHEAAIPTLKELTTNVVVGDDAAYLIALSYDRQTATKLAIGSYRQYLERFPQGNWSVEAKVRVEELEAAAAPVKTRQVVARTNCPFCKSELLPEAPLAECVACGTVHHAGCYEEQGGCAVYGCESKSAKARVKA